VYVSRVCATSDNQDRDTTFLRKYADIFLNIQLNHAIQLSPDGQTIYTSSYDIAYKTGYDSIKIVAVGSRKTLIQGMGLGPDGFKKDHTTRTLLLSKKNPGTLLVSRGSAANMDYDAADIKKGISQIRAFNVASASSPVRYTDGDVIGWGLRNSIGMDEHPGTGGIWSNENGSDDYARFDKAHSKSGNNIHEDSPGEEVNFHGILNGTVSTKSGGNYGYPRCAATWNPAVMNNEALKVGHQFFVGNYSAQTTPELDKECSNTETYIAPRLTLPPHWAPIDMKFNKKGSVAYMTSRGSW
jgi:hypothetical protein